MSLLTKTQVAAYLGRPLTSSEDANFKSYIQIAEQRLQSLLCFSLESKTDTRTYASRAGYRTLFIDPFTEVAQVKLDGQEVTTYVKKQNDEYQGDWFNSLEFDDVLCGNRVEVTGTWGIGDCLPDDLASLLAGLFGIHEAESSNVKSKKIEDFSITYKDGVLLDGLVLKHATTVSKYARQNEGAISHGFARPVYYL